MTELQKAILRTLAYADVFDYPLTSKELYRFLIIDNPPSFSSFKKALSLINADLKLIDADGDFYCLGGREAIIDIRKKREKWSQEKLKIGNHVASWLRLIPWIKMVGVTGALALANSDKDDDIDILIVSGENRLWLTRLLAAFLTELLGQRRRPGQSDVRDKICLNMFLDEDRLVVPKKEQDLFSAHEVCQMKKLWDRDNTYKKFLVANRWVKNYLPNALHTTHNMQHITLNTNQRKMFHVPRFMLHALENLSKTFQLWYMRKRRTTEVVSDGVLRFHPQDARNWVLQEYHLRLSNLGLDKF